MIRTHITALMLIAAVALAGCETPAEPEQPQLTFQHLPNIMLRVSDIQIANSSTQSVQTPHVAHRFPVPPVQALTRWAEDRLQSAGGSGRAKFSILKADVVETKLKTDENLTGLFKKEISEKYEATAEASLEVFDVQGIRRAIVIAGSDWTRTVREDATLAERKQIWFEIVEKLMERFNTEMEKSIRTHMSAHLR
jgi:hypothetical protein